MLIEGGYLDSLKKLLEKADALERGTTAPSGKAQPPATPPKSKPPRRLRTSLRAISSKLFRRTAGSA
jgi:hypothetical protein